MSPWAWTCLLANAMNATLTLAGNAATVMGIPVPTQKEHRAGSRHSLTRSLPAGQFPAVCARSLRHVALALPGCGSVLLGMSW